MPPSRAPPARSYCFTLNGTERPLPDAEDLLGRIEGCRHFRYVIFQLEIGPTGNRHYQGYVEFSKPVRYNDLKDAATGCHVEIRRGTRQQARDYCRKDDSRDAGPWERGQWTGGAGERTDILLVKALVDAGASDVAIADAHFKLWLSNYRGLREYRDLLKQPDRGIPNVRAFIGPTGTGKSYAAANEYPDAWWFTATKDSVWFDTYQGEETVIFDEFAGWMLPWNTLLRLIDRYPVRVPVKGRSTHWNARVIIFTSNSRVEDWYSSPHPIEALLRRFTEIKMFNSRYVEVINTNG